MASPHKQTSEYMDWLQSDIDGPSLSLNQLDQDHDNVAEEVGPSNTNDEEYMTNIWSDNQGVDEEYMANIWSDNQGVDAAMDDYAGYTGQVDNEGYTGQVDNEGNTEQVDNKDEIYERLLNELETTIFPGSACVEEWCRVLGLGVYNEEEIKQAEIPTSRISIGSKRDKLCFIS